MKNEFLRKQFIVMHLLFLLITCFQIKLSADGIKSNIHGIITGKWAALRNAPYGITTKELRDGEVVFIIKKENQKNLKNKDDYWYKVVTVNGKIGWVDAKSINYLDEYKIPEKYYNQVLPKKVGYKDSLLYNVQFNFFEGYNVIAYRFYLKDPPTQYEAMVLVDVTNGIAQRASFHHDYNSRVVIDNKYVFVIDSSEITIYDKMIKDSAGDYKSVSRISVLNSENIIKDSFTFKYFKWNNSYFIKLKISTLYSKSVKEEIYRFNGEKIIYLDNWQKSLLKLYKF